MTEEAVAEDKRMLVEFSQTLIDVIDDFKEEMEILANEDTVRQISESMASSRSGKTRVLTLKELKRELGI